jgi:hypothetical protein
VAALDDRLIKPFAAGIPSTMPRDDVDINSKLIYLYHLAASDLAQSV